MTAIRISLASTCLIWSLLAAPSAWGQLAPYSQDFEGLAEASPSPGNTALSGDGWLAFANVFQPDGVTFDAGYSSTIANITGTGAAFANVATGEGGAEQGAKQLVVFNDYNNENHGNGSNKRIEANVYQQQTIPGSAAATSVLFRFDAKKGNIAAGSTAIAFIKTLDPGNNFALSNFISIDTTGLPVEWSNYGIQFDIDAAIQGHLFQIGYASTASNFEASGIVYDNVDLAPAPVCPGEQILANRKLETSSPQVRDAAVSATVGPNFTAAGSSISVNAPTVVFGDNVNIGGGFTAGNAPGSCTPV